MQFTKEFLQQTVKYIDGEPVLVSDPKPDGSLGLSRPLTMREAIRKGLNERREPDASTAEERMQYAILSSKVWNEDNYAPSSEEISVIKKRVKEYWLGEVALFVIQQIDPSSVGLSKTTTNTTNTKVK